MQLNVEHFEFIERNYNIKINKVTRINSVYKLYCFDRIYIFKLSKNKKLDIIYNTLTTQKFKHFVAPCRSAISNAYYVIISSYYGYLFPYVENIYYPHEKKLIDYVDVLRKLHEVTLINKKFDKLTFMKIYKKQRRGLRHVFEGMDDYLKESEVSNSKTVFQWTFLMNYKTIMRLKNMLIHLQDKMNKRLESIDLFFYCIVHNNCTMDHFLVENGQKYLINFDQSFLGIRTHDYVKLYIENADVEIDWYRILFGDFEDPFEIQFLVYNILYYLVLNININKLTTSKTFEAINQFVDTLSITEKIMDLYDMFLEQLTAASEADDTYYQQ